MRFGTDRKLVNGTSIDICATNINHCRLYEEELPEDLWIEIFVRLSVESLLRIKCVCRHWYALVKNPGFTKKHLQFQKAVGKDKERFLLKYYYCDSVTQRFNYFLIDEESVASGTTSSSSSCILLHPSLYEPWSNKLCIEGPINGLYCVYDGRDRFVIWNPSTQEVGFLPCAEECLPDTGDGYDSDDPLVIFNVLIGFGVDPLNEDDYKVLLICMYDRRRSDDQGFCRMLYTASTNTWRLLEDDNFVGSGEPDEYSSNNTYLNGFYYFWAARERVALAFDMGKEEAFQTISTPNIYSGNAPCHGELVLHDDHITLVIVKKNLCEVDIWVLNVEESIWTKRISVGGIQGVEKALGFWKKNDELLLVIDDSEGQPCHGLHSQTVLYNATTQKITNIGPKGWATLFSVTVYCESFNFPEWYWNNQV